MLKKYYLISILLLLVIIILYETNPDYKQHENLVAVNCQSKVNEDKTSICPLGFGKNTSGFERKEFNVYSAGILSYSIYEKKFSSFGILGNVFLALDNKES